MVPSTLLKSNGCRCVKWLFLLPGDEFVSDDKDKPSCFLLLQLTVQLFDDADELRRKVRQLAAAVRQSNHLVVYTGAGISTVRSPLPLQLPSPPPTIKGPVFSFRQLLFRTTGVLMGFGPSCRRAGRSGEAAGRVAPLLQSEINSFTLLVLVNQTVHLT